jgi:hypothetical protein
MPLQFTGPPRSFEVKGKVTRLADLTFSCFFSQPIQPMYLAYTKIYSQFSNVCAPEFSLAFQNKHINVILQLDI